MQWSKTALEIGMCKGPLLGLYNMMCVCGYGLVFDGVL